MKKKIVIFLSILLVLSIALYCFLIRQPSENNSIVNNENDVEISLDINETMYPAYPIGAQIDVFKDNDIDLSLLDITYSNEGIVSIVDNKITACKVGSTTITFIYKLTI